jgi:hypothetical protein
MSFQVDIRVAEIRIRPKVVYRRTRNIIKKFEKESNANWILYKDKNPEISKSLKVRFVCSRSYILCA